jgi:histone deacetylase 1/2
MSSDIPAFPGFYEHSRLVAGSSILAAELLCQNKHDVVLNWLGGLHHARKSKASGFCYVNDCVLAIMRLLYDFNRVLYIDIDVHHGDGVEEAFLMTNRVMTLSFHQYDPDTNFFPGTGSVSDRGCGEGKNYAVNVPLRKGCSDENFEFIFQNVLDKTLDRFHPDAIVLQSGADSLVGDIIGGFNLSIKGHGKAFKYVLDKNLPTICLGGGGYTVENVSRCWAYESAIAVGIDLSNQLPKNLEYMNEYSQHVLHYSPGNVHKIGKDYNDREYIFDIIGRIDKNLKNLEARPGVCFGERPDISTFKNRIEQCSINSDDSDDKYQADDNDYDIII